MTEKAKKRIDEVKKTQAKYLNLSDCSLKEIPKELCEMPWLTVLHLSNNQISEIKGLEKLGNLITLWLSNNEIIEIKGLEKLNKLKELTLFDNKITEIKGIEQLRELTELWLHNNHIKKITSLDKLNKLTEFRLDNNHIEDIQILLPLIEQIEISVKEYNYKDNTLHLYNNPITTPPIEILLQGSEGTINYFKTLEYDDEDYIFEAKMLVLGSGAVGKTSLSEKIIDTNYELKSDTQENTMTEGIDILNYDFPIANNKEFKVNIWDFGGQAIYHATHQFFLTKRSLYILVTDTRKEDDDLPYWLNIQQLLAGDSPLLIIQNEKYDQKKLLSKDDIRNEFSNVKAIMSTNLKDNRGLKEIIKEVHGELQKLTHIGDKLPKSWVNIRRELESLDKNHISQQSYFDICARHGMKDTEGNFDQKRALWLSEYFHDLGVILHFQKDPILERIVILNNEWATDAVYNVLDDKKVEEQWGQFSFDDLKNIWPTSQYQDKHIELVALMKKIKLCFELKDRKKYIAPQRLPVEKPHYDWGEKKTLQLKYTYTFMPKGILGRLIVDMHTYIKDKFIWATGGIFEKDNSIAEVLEVYGKNEISIQIKGESREAFRAIIMNEIDQINDSFQNLKVKKLVPCNCKTCYNSKKTAFHNEKKLQTSYIHQRYTFECDIPPFEKVDVLSMLGSIGNEISKGKTELTKKIRILIKKGKIKKALLLLTQDIKSIDETLENEVIQLSSRYETNKKAKRKGNIKGSDSELIQNQISDAILEIVADIENIDFN